MHSHNVHAILSNFSIISLHPFDAVLLTGKSTTDHVNCVQSGEHWHSLGKHN